MRKQKFRRGNKVRIADDYSTGYTFNGKGGKCVPWKSPHAGKDAIVIGSYADEYGGKDTKSYTLLFDEGEVSWFDERALTLIEQGGEHLIEQNKRTRDARDFVHGDLKWIVENWPKIRHCPPGASMKFLMSEIGITDPWGKFGEGVDYYANGKFTFNLLDPVLSTGDVEKVKLFILEFPKIDGSIQNTRIE